MSDVELVDHGDQAKVLVRAAPGGTTAAALGVPYGRAARDAAGTLVVGAAPDGWLLLAPSGSARTVMHRAEALAGGEFASVVDLTHGHAVIRLTGHSAASVLARVCAIDLAGAPDGTVVRTLVANVHATVIRDDARDEPSYLLLYDRSYGEYLAGVLADASR